MEATMSIGITLELTVRVLAIGAGATILMDVWLALLKRVGLPGMNFALLGRWLAHLPRGIWAQPAKQPPIRGELAIGWAAHYLIGIAFAALLVLMKGPEWAREPTFLPALLAGIVSVVAPLFILQPAMGAGVAASKTPTPVRNNLRSLANHAVFGVGLYLAAVGSAQLTANWG
jgi:hypothetical protein